MQYIPEKIEVKITKSDKTSFVTYKTLKGVLKKPQSYKNFGEAHTVTEETFKNEPLIGFKVVDFSTSYASYKFTTVKIEDPRGFQFELNTENLVGLLGTSDYKGAFMNPLIYSWENGSNVLLDATTKEYKEAEEYSCNTRAPTIKVDLVPGYMYQGAQGGKYLFLGVLPFLSLQPISGKETAQNLKSKTTKVFKIIGKGEAPFVSLYYDRSFTIKPERLIKPIHNDIEYDYDRILQSYKDSKYYGTKMKIFYEPSVAKGIQIHVYTEVQAVLYKNLLMVAYLKGIHNTLNSDIVLHPTGCIEKTEPVYKLESSPDASYVIVYYNTDLNPLKRPYFEPL